MIASAVAEGECSVPSGFDPEGDVEAARSATAHQELGIDRRDRSHELPDCNDDSTLRSPKRVLQRWVRNDRQRESHYWQRTPLSGLRDRGGRTGLADYLRVVRDRLAPLIGSGFRRRRRSDGADWYFKRERPRGGNPRGRRSCGGGN